MPAISSFFAPKIRHFGISIGRTTLRAVELDQTRKVSAATEIVIPETVFKEGVLIDKKTFTLAISKLLQAGKFTTKYVAVCFPEAYAYSRDYSVPLIPISEVREAISWHVKDLFPFPEDEIYFDWRLLETTETEHKVAVVAVQKQVLDSQVEALIGVGLKPLGFQPGAAAISKLLTLKPDEYSLVCEVNQKGAYVTLVEGEKTLFTTVINHTAEDTPETYLKNTTQTIQEIATFYKNKGVLKDVAVPVILTGELATQEMAQKSGEALKFPVKILKTPIQNPAFNKAFSVAANPVAPPDDETSINLLPAQIQKHYDQERTTVFYKTLLLRTSLVLLIFFLVSLGSFIAVTIKRQQLDHRVKELTAAANTQRPDTQNLLLLNAQANNIVALSPLRATPKDTMLVIASVLPETVTVSQWEYDDNKLLYTLHGSAADRSELLTLKSKLDATGEFAKITLPLGTLESPKNVQFSISFVVEK